MVLQNPIVIIVARRELKLAMESRFIRFLETQLREGLSKGFMGLQRDVRTVGRHRFACRPVLTALLKI
jgi:hypothetical protein